MLKKFLLFLSIFSLIVGTFGLTKPALAEATVSLDELEAGDLIRGESLAAVYYFGKDGFRYVFPNDKTYFTWYSNFDDVKWLKDNDLGKIQIGGNVTYKPGIKMVKINSDPKTYAVGQNGTLHWVTSEEVAIALYGSSWNTMIDDVPDAFFSNYNVGGEIEVAGDFVPSEETASVDDINDDKSLKSPYIITITSSGYSDTTLDIEAGRAVKFLNKDIQKHTATSEDLTWGSGTIEAGGSFIRYFKTEGEFPFFCSYHESETGTITAK